MKDTIQFIATTPEELKNDIVKELAQKLTDIVGTKEDPEKLMTREETAKFLDINLTTLGVWTKDKKLKAYGIGNRVYYKRSELLQAAKPINE